MNLAKLSRDRTEQKKHVSQLGCCCRRAQVLSQATETPSNGLDHNQNKLSMCQYQAICLLSQAEGNAVIVCSRLDHSPL